MYNKNKCVNAPIILYNFIESLPQFSIFFKLTSFWSNWWQSKKGYSFTKNVQNRFCLTFIKSVFLSPTSAMEGEICSFHRMQRCAMLKSRGLKLKTMFGPYWEEKSIRRPQFDVKKALRANFKRAFSNWLH